MALRQMQAQQGEAGPVHGGKNYTFTGNRFSPSLPPALNRITLLVNNQRCCCCCRRRYLLACPTLEGCDGGARRKAPSCPNGRSKFPVMHLPRTRGVSVVYFYLRPQATQLPALTPLTLPAFRRNHQDAGHWTGEPRALAEAAKYCREGLGGDWLTEPDGQAGCVIA